jgi:ribose transport system ATP-binding protein
VVRDLSKTFGTKTVLDAFNMELQPGEIHVVLGQNGSGKSTLIKILSGYHVPDDGGAVLIGGQPLEFGSSRSSYRLGCRFVHQDLALVSGLSVLDNLFVSGSYPTTAATIRRREARKRAKAALGNLGLDMDPESDVATLRPAERTGVAVARALLAAEDVKPHVLVLDEPTATLPDNEVDRLLSTLRSVAASGVAIIYVTHHLDEVAEFAHRVSVLRDGRLVSTRPIAGLDRQQLVHDMIGERLEAVERLAQAQHRERFGSPILSVEDLRAGPLRGIGLEAWAGEITGLCGLTGSGREVVLGAIFGATARDEGSVRISGEPLPPGRPDAAIRAGVAYLSPDRRASGAVMDMSARDNLTLANLKAFWRKLNLWSKLETAEAESWFEWLEVRPRDGVKLPLSSFSGGNQQKVLFAKWLRLSPRLLLMDEPTQGVDVGAKAELHRRVLAAAAMGAAVVISSTDLDELSTLCDRVLFIRNGAVTTELVGADITRASVSRSFHIGAYYVEREV